MGETWAIVVILDGVGRVLAVTGDASVCEFLRGMVAQALGVPTVCQMLGRAA